MMLKLIKNRKLRASATSASIASAGVPDSGFAFINNSHGASAAIAELSTRLDEALERIDLDGDSDDQLRYHLDQLDAEASKYVNSSLDESRCRPWICQRPVALLADAAMQCSLAAYDERYSPQLDSVEFTASERIRASETSLAKAIYTTIVERKAASKPVFVFAVRGSASILDHVVNLNGGAKDVEGFIPIESLNNARSTLESKIEAHPGLLDSSKAVLPVLVQKLNSSSIQDAGHVMFTGHSAGGAVASLLYAHCKADLPLSRKFRFSLITFGSPPVINQDLSSRLPKHNHSKTEGIVLNFVNEYDLVTRSTRNYIRSLVDLFRSIYGLPHIKDQGTVTEDWKVLNGLGPQFSGDGSLPTPHFSKLPLWDLPRPELFHLGPIVVLKAGYSSAPTPAETTCDWDLRAYLVPPDEFRQLLFCRVSVHSRQIYTENMREISKGCVNGRTGWQ